MAQESTVKTGGSIPDDVLNFINMGYVNCPECGNEVNPNGNQARCNVHCPLNGRNTKVLKNIYTRIADKDLDKIVKGDKAKFSVDSDGHTIWEF